MDTVKGSPFTEGGLPTSHAFASEDERRALSGKHPLLRVPSVVSSSSEHNTFKSC